MRCRRRRLQLGARRHRRQAGADGADEPQRLERLVEAHRHARGDVAVAMRRHRAPRAGRRAATAWSQRRSAACPLARPARPVRPSWAASCGRHAAGAEEAVLQAGMLVVDDPAARAPRARCASHCARRRSSIDGVRSTATPPGTMASIMKRWPKASLDRRCQSSRRRENCARPKRQRGVVAQGAQVAQVVGDALALQHQRTQPGRARRDFAAPGRLERHAIGPGVGHRRVARHAAGEPVGLQRRQLGEAALDALVHVAQVLFEPQHLLADDREAEVARLDDAGVHRADGDLVHAVAFDAHEGVVGGQRAGGGRRRLGVVLQRRRSGRPHAVVQPGALVAAALGLQTGQVGHRALHPRRTREGGRQVRKPLRRIVERAVRARPALRARHRRHSRHAAARRAAVAAPHRDQSPAAVRDAACRRAPRLAVDLRMPDRQRRRQAAQIESEVASVPCGQFPSIAAAWRYQASR